MRIVGYVFGNSKRKPVAFPYAIIAEIERFVQLRVYFSGSRLCVVFKRIHGACGLSGDFVLYHVALLRTLNLHAALVVVVNDIDFVSKLYARAESPFQGSCYYVVEIIFVFLIKEMRRKPNREFTAVETFGCGLSEPSVEPLLSDVGSYQLGEAFPFML